jgi:hypothetical protein
MRPQAEQCPPLNAVPSDDSDRPAAVDGPLCPSGVGPDVHAQVRRDYIEDGAPLKLFDPETRLHPKRMMRPLSCGP